MCARAVIEATPTEVVFMGDVGKGICTGEMRHRNLHPGTVPADPMNFLHRGDDIVQVLDDIVGQNFVEGTIGKRPRTTIQIMRDVGRDAGLANRR